jgi:hypothetical protein
MVSYKASLLTVVNGRDKVICVNGLETNEITNKVSTQWDGLTPGRSFTISIGREAQIAQESYARGSARSRVGERDLECTT